MTMTNNCTGICKGCPRLKANESDSPKLRQLRKEMENLVSDELTTKGSAARLIKDQCMIDTSRAQQDRHYNWRWVDQCEHVADYQDHMQMRQDEEGGNPWPAPSTDPWDLCDKDRIPNCDIPE